MDKKALIVILLTVICWIVYAQAGGDMAQSIQRGQRIYATNCQACHQDKGQGIEGMYPPLLKSRFVEKDTKRAIDIVLHGIDGKMPAQKQLNDRQVTDVLNFIRNSWGNKGQQIAVAQVKIAR